MTVTTPLLYLSVYHIITLSYPSTTRLSHPSTTPSHPSVTRNLSSLPPPSLPPSLSHTVCVTLIFGVINGVFAKGRGVLDAGGRRRGGGAVTCCVFEVLLHHALMQLLDDQLHLYRLPFRV